MSDESTAPASPGDSSPWSINEDRELEASLSWVEFGGSATERLRLAADGVLVVLLGLAWATEPALALPTLGTWWVVVNALRWRDDPHVGRWLLVAGIDAVVVAACGYAQVPLVMYAFIVAGAEALWAGEAFNWRVASVRLAVGPAWVRVSTAGEDTQEPWIPLESLRPRLVRTRSGLGVELHPGCLVPVDAREADAAKEVVLRLQRAAALRLTHSTPPDDEKLAELEALAPQAHTWLDHPRTYPKPVKAMLQTMAMVLIMSASNLWGGEWLRAAKVVGATMVGMSPLFARLATTVDRRKVYEVVEVLVDHAAPEPQARSAAIPVQRARVAE